MSEPELIVPNKSQFDDHQIRTDVFYHIKNRKKNDQKWMYELRQLNNWYKIFFEEEIYEAKIHYSYIDDFYLEDLRENTIFGGNLTKISITFEPIQNANTNDHYYPKNSKNHPDNDLSQLAFLSKNYFPNVQKLDVIFKNTIYKQYVLNSAEPLHFQNLNLITDSKKSCELQIVCNQEIIFENSYFENISLDFWNEFGEDKNLTLENCTVKNTLNAIQINDTFQSVNLKKLKILQDFENFEAGWGCLIWQTKNLTLDDIIVKNCKEGLLFENGKNISISGVKLSDCKLGCQFFDATGKIFDSEIENCDVGINLADESQIKWKNVRFIEEGEGNVVVEPGSVWTWVMN